jgi:hypothetical protein
MKLPLPGHHSPKSPMVGYHHLSHLLPLPQARQGLRLRSVAVQNRSLLSMSSTHHGPRHCASIWTARDHDLYHLLGLPQALQDLTHNPYHLFRLRQARQGLRPRQSGQSKILRCDCDQPSQWTKALPKHLEFMTAMQQSSEEKCALMARVLEPEIIARFTWE